MDSLGRNLISKYFEWTNDLIKNDLKKNCLPFAVLICHLNYDFNISNVIRSANSFGAQEIYYYGHKKWDRRGAQGSHIYLHLTHLKEISDVEQLKEKYSFVALENNIKDTILLHKFKWPTDKFPLICVGEEGTGIATEIMELVDFKVEIESRGSVRSLNSASAATCAMFDFCSKYEAQQ